MTTHEIRIVVPGPVPRKNDRSGIRIVVPNLADAEACEHCGNTPKGDPFPSVYPSASWKDWIARLSMEVSHLDKLDRGAWRIEIHHYSPKVRHLDGGTLHVAYCDADSPTSAVLDGLKAVGVIDDDMRFLAESARKHVDKANPRTEITLIREDEATTQLDLAGTITREPARAPKRKGKGKGSKVPRPDDLADF